MTKKFVAVAAFAFAMAFAVTASAVSATAIYTPASGYLMVGSGMGAKAYQAANVMAAQDALNACTGSNLEEDGKFGPLTKGVFMSFQQSKGIKVDGIIGSQTAATLAACSGSSTPSNPSSNNNSGEAGDINAITELGSPSNESVGEGEDDVEVLGFEIETDNGSDIEISSVKVEFDHAFGSEVSGSSDHLDDYIDRVSVWMGNEEVGSADVDEFSETDDGVYSKNISLDDAVVDSDDTVRFYVAVDANSSVDSGDFDEQWGVELESVRFTDGTGAILTDTPGSTVQMYFTLESFADAADVSLKLSLDSDSPEDQVVEVDDGDDTTDGVELLKFKIKAEGSDISIDEIPVLFTVTGASNVDEVTDSVNLIVDGEDDFSESMTTTAGSTETITFDDLDLVISEGETMEFTVTADINGIGGDADAGDTLKADITSTERDAIDAEDEEGENLGTSTGDRTGSALGEEQSFYATGLMFELVSTSSAITTTGDASATTPTSDIGTFTIKYKLTAFGSDLSINRACEEGGSDAADQGVEYIITNGGSNTTVCSVSSTADNNPSDSGASWLLEEGQTETFTLTVAATASADHFAKVYLESINYDEDTTDTSPDQYFTSGLGEDMTSTSELYLNDN